MLIPNLNYQDQEARQFSCRAAHRCAPPPRFADPLQYIYFLIYSPLNSMKIFTLKTEIPCNLPDCFE